MRLTVKYAEIERQHREHEEIESHPKPGCVCHVPIQKWIRCRLALCGGVELGRSGRFEMALGPPLALLMTVIDSRFELCYEFC